MCSIALYINLSLVQEWSPSLHTGSPPEPSQCEALRHGRHVHVVLRKKRWSLFLFPSCLFCIQLHFLSYWSWLCLFFSPSVLTEVFDFLHQTELEASSVAALRKKYGVWRKRFTKTNNIYRLRTSTRISALFSKLRTHCKYVLTMNKLPLACSAALQTLMYRNKTLMWNLKETNCKSWFFQCSNPFLFNDLWLSDASWLNVSSVNNKYYFYIHV